MGTRADIDILRREHSAFYEREFSREPCLSHSGDAGNSYRAHTRPYPVSNDHTPFHAIKRQPSGFGGGVMKSIKIALAF